MAVGILLVTHGKLGHLLLETLRDFMGTLPLPADVLEVRRVQAPDILLRQGCRMISNLDQGDGVLVITDAYGSTPGNIANRLTSETSIKRVAGVNLPMLMRVFNYPQLGLESLAIAAIEGGQKGILLCPETPEKAPLL
jgi:PTS system ascorbate-specific IIA component